MSLYVTAKDTGTDFEPHPAGSFAARCTRIIDLGHQQTIYNGQQQLSHKILLGFQTSKLMPDGEKKGQPYLVTVKYTASLSKKALLRRDLETWRGRAFAEHELPFDIGAVLGKAAMLNIVHSDQNPQGRVYANVKSISSLPEGMTAPQAAEKPYFFSLSDYDQAVFDQLSDRMKEQIAKSPEYKGIKSGKPARVPVSTEMDDDDIPF